MPSFPDSVFAPANRSNGQTIDASHVNGVQDELVAIEAGYINGTARLNSSNLSVLGTSTFASRPAMPPPDAVRATLTSSQAQSSADIVIRNLKTQTFITNSSMHSTTTNSSRVTPQSTGLYRCVGSVAFNSVSSGVRSAQILDSSDAIVGRVDAPPVTSGDQTIVQVTATKRFDVTGGYIRLGATFTAASTLSINGGGNTWLEVTKI